MLIRFLFRSWSTVQRALVLARDARVPMHLKLGALAATIFVLSPLNILGDIPLLGLADDAAMLAGVAALFVRFAESSMLRTAPQRSASPGYPAIPN